MASPFRVFRKYQKTFLAIAGVVLMFVFVVGDSLFSYLGGGRNARAGDDQDAKATAVHWDGGKLSNRELNELVMRRRILNNFLKSVAMEGQRPAALAGVDPPELGVQPLIAPETQLESSVVRTKLLADAAREAGMKVSDDTLLQYLNDLGRKNVTPEQMRSMLKNISMGGSRVSTDYVLEALREEMLAYNYLVSHEFSFRTITPQQRWKDWLRVNDRVVIEAAAVPAEMYLADVKEPTEAELAAFFEKYKDREARPDFYGNTEMPSATPGFKIPRKLDLQFVEANYEEFLAKAEPKVTDAEIAKFYEEHKDLFTKTSMGLTEDKKDPAKDKPKSDSPKSDAPKSDASKSDTPKADAPKSDSPESKNDAKSDEKAKPSEPVEKKTESSEKKDAPPAANDGKSDGKSSDAKKSSAHPNPTKSIFRLTAFAQDADKKDEKANKAAEKPSEAPAAKTDAAATPASPAADKPATTAPPVVPPTTPPATPPAAPPEASKPAPATPGEAAPKKPVEYQPLSEVKDQIRKRLAEGKVGEELTKLMGGVQDQLDSDFNTWRYSDSESSRIEKEPRRPAPPASLTDLAAIAQKNGLKSGKTGLKTGLELRELPVGKTVGFDSNRSLLSLLFQGHDLEMYQPVKTIDPVDKNFFVVQKIGDTPEKVPTLAEVKDEVVKAWKKQQAAELAKKHAEEFAKKAEDAKTPLASFFAENKSIKVIRTDPFSELTGGEASFVGGQIQRTPYRFSQPSELLAPSPEFLRGVFELKDGQVGVLMNNDNSIAYIVRIVEHQPALPELRNAYMAEADSWDGERFMGDMHRQEVASNLELDIKARTNLQWDREHDKAKEEQRDDG